MLHNIFELSGKPLDYAMALALEKRLQLESSQLTQRAASGLWKPSSSWSDAGPILEREKVSLVPHGDAWRCNVEDVQVFGSTMLEAAVRAVAMRYLGALVALPEAMR